MDVEKQLSTFLNEKLKTETRKGLYLIIKELGYKAMAEHVLFNDRVIDQVNFLIRRLENNTKRYNLQGERLHGEDIAKLERSTLKMTTGLRDLRNKYASYN